MAALKRTAPEAELVVLGSGELLRSLLREDLVDELLLLVHPLVLGSGTRLFEAGGPGLTLGLASSVTTTTGVLISTYHRARRMSRYLLSVVTSPPTARRPPPEELDDDHEERRHAPPGDAAPPAPGCSPAA